MAVNYIGGQINQSPTITAKAGANVDDGRNKLYKFNTNGELVLAGAGENVVGIGLIESGYNDVTGAEAGKVKQGDDLTVQIKDIGLVMAGAEISVGAEVASNEAGLAVTATDGNYVIGTALDKATASGDYIYIAINKYKKPTA